MTTTSISFFGNARLHSLKDIICNSPFDESIPNVPLNDSYYYNTDQFKDIASKNSTLTIASLNCQSLNAKHSEKEILINTLSNSSLDVLCLQETWLADDADVSLLQLPNYQLVWRGATTSRHGGVAIFIRSSLKYSLLPHTPPSNIWEAVFIQIDSNLLTKPLIIGSIYRPPTQTNAEKITFIDEFSQTLHSLQQTNHSIIVTGDFNFNLLKLHQNDLITQFFNSITSIGFDPLITFPTRTTDSSHTLIDNIFCNSSNTLSPLSGILTSPISDHQLCFTQIRTKHSQKQTKHITITQHPPNLHELIKTDLRNMNILQTMNPDIETDPTDNCDLLQSTITSLINKYTTSKTVKFNKHKHKKSAWITQGIIKSIKYRDKLHLQMKRTDIDSPLRNTLKINIATYNKILKKTIRQAKALHYTKLFAQNTNAQDTWKAINKTLNRNTKTDSHIDQLTVNNTTYNTPKEMADCLNNFFTTIGHTIASKIPPTTADPQTYMRPHNSPPFSFSTIPQTEIDIIIKNLKPKHSTGHDDINTTLLKSLREEITPPLTLIANQMITSSIFPNSLKIAKIKPIFKKGNKELCENYRPISLLPALSKILEKVMLKQINNHFTENNLYYDSQYGFRKKHSTEHALIEFTDQIITSLDNNETPTSIFIDLTKAFDCLDHDILLHKLKHYGLEDKALKLCTHYLTNRKQYIKLPEASSDLLNIDTGVPQGSILGPLFFLIYINDLPNSSETINFITYADDTTLLTTLNPQTHLNNINNELAKVFKWFCTNKLSLNATKTKAITFHTPQRQITPPLLAINDQPIENTDHTNFLGIIIDKHLTFKPHINKLTTKISQISGVLNKLKHFIPQHISKTIYQTLIVPHITYGSLAWSHSRHTHILTKLLKRPIRIIANAKYNAHTEPLYKKYRCLKFEDLRNLKELKFYHNWKRGVLPRYFDTMITVGREENRLRVPMHRHEFFKLGLRYSIVNTVNSTPRHLMCLTSTHSIKAFSNRLKDYFIDQYSTYCVIPNCYVCRNS